jgi:DNA-binding response OmpR family regulator
MVEDSMLLRAANKSILTRAGYTVLTAGDGEEALHLVRQHRPDPCERTQLLRAFR